MEVDGNEGRMGGGAGEGALLHGSSPSSYMELARGLSCTKLPPKPFVEDTPYGCAGLGALNMVWMQPKGSLDASRAVRRTSPSMANRRLRSRGCRVTASPAGCNEAVNGVTVS